MADYQGPGLTNPVYDISQSVEINVEKDLNTSEKAQEEDPSKGNQDAFDHECKDRSKSNASMFIDLLIVASDKATDTHSIYEEKEAILIDDERQPCSEDTIIDLNIDSEALKFVSVFLLFTLQRIPRHFSDQLKTILSVCQVFIVIGMITAVAYDMGAFKNNTLTVNELDNPVTSVKNFLYNAKYPLLYIVGIFYFKTRHLETMLSNMRITKRYWKYGRKVLIGMVTSVLCLSVLIPVISGTVQMLFTNKSSPEIYKCADIVISCILALVVRLMSLSVVFAFILVGYLIYCQVRMFKEQIQKWPLECTSLARNFYNDICRLIRNAERAFQPFLIVHFTLFLFLLIPWAISYVEQYETKGRYDHVITTSNSIPLKAPVFIVDAPSQSSLAQFKNKNQETHKNNTKSAMDDFNNNAIKTRESELDPPGIVKICLMFLSEVFDVLALFGLPVVLMGKVEKCIKAIRDTIRMLNFGQQTDNHYMFQSEKDIAVWDSILSDARGIHVLGFNLASFKGVLITLLFPFVTVVLRSMLRHVNINP